eukprot:Sspe_Gene.77025::Locus_48101_Transcript_1_1_Confidence_1.000_Length_1413::g.77025::m.77025
MAFYSAADLNAAKRRHATGISDILTNAVVEQAPSKPDNMMAHHSMRRSHSEGAVIGNGSQQRYYSARRLRQDKVEHQAAILFEGSPRPQQESPREMGYTSVQRLNADKRMHLYELDTSPCRQREQPSPARSNASQCSSFREYTVAKRQHRVTGDSARANQSEGEDLSANLIPKRRTSFLKLADDRRHHSYVSPQRVKGAPEPPPSPREGRRSSYAEIKRERKMHHLSYPYIPPPPKVEEPQPRQLNSCKAFSKYKKYHLHELNASTPSGKLERFRSHSMPLPADGRSQKELSRNKKLHHLDFTPPSGGGKDRSCRSYEEYTAMKTRHQHTAYRGKPLPDPISNVHGKFISNRAMEARIRKHSYTLGSMDGSVPPSPAARPGGLRAALED